MDTENTNSTAVSGGKNPDSLYFEADRLSRDGKFAEAKDLLMEVLTLKADHAQALNFLGWLHETKYYDYAKAREFYERALQANPNYPAANVNYAILLSTINEYTALAPHLERAMNVPGVSKSAIFREYGLMFENQENLANAIEAYKKALQLSTNQSEIDGYKAAVKRCEDKLAFKNGTPVAPAPAAPMSAQVPPSSPMV